MKIYKLTSATFPAASANWGHDYSEGGDEVSLPYNGETRAVLVRQNGGSWWLIDFTPGVGVGNPRPLTGNLAPLHGPRFHVLEQPGHSLLRLREQRLHHSALRHPDHDRGPRQWLAGDR